jgi:L-amino acid N-acyltransferase YncA
MIIRRARSEDAKQIHDVQMQSIQMVCARDHSEEEIKAWGHRPYNEAHRLHAINNQYVWVVEYKNKVEGFAHLDIFEKEDIKQAHVYGLYLTPTVLGQGFGGDLAKLMIEESRKAGAKKLSLESTLTSHNFYLKLGFVDEGPMITVDINGTLIRCHPMTLKL